MVNLYREELFSLTIYILLFGRYFLMKPFYMAHKEYGSINYDWRKIIPTLLIFLVLYWLFFLNPIHRDVCSASKVGILCTDLGKAKYFAFPARVIFYWTIILAFLNLAFRNSLEDRK